MNNKTAIEFIDFSLEYADELVVMWRASFEQAVGVNDPHPIAEQRDYLLNEVAANNSIRMALLNRQVVAFIAATPESISQLYVHINHQGNGIGSKLLAWAKKRSCGKLWLYTFERNKGAQQFYVKSGFKIIARGFEESWQLADIKYEWVNQVD